MLPNWCRPAQSSSLRSSLERLWSGACRAQACCQVAVHYLVQRCTTSHGIPLDTKQCNALTTSASLLYLVQCCRVSPIEHWREALSATNSTTTLVTDEVLHPIGNIQPLLIGWNLPDQVESRRQRTRHLGAPRCGPAKRQDACRVRPAARSARCPRPRPCRPRRAAGPQPTRDPRGRPRPSCPGRPRRALRRRAGRSP